MTAPTLADEFPARVRFVNGRTRHRVRRPDSGHHVPEGVRSSEGAS